MKRVVIATLAVGLMMGTTAFAQEQRPERPHESGHSQSGHSHSQNVSRSGPETPIRGGVRQGGSNYSRGIYANPNSGSVRGAERTNRESRGYTRRYSEERSGSDSFAHSDRRHGAFGGAEDERMNERGSTMMGRRHDERGFGTRPENWNQQPRNFSRGEYQHNITSEHHFHFGTYEQPSGWYYRRWSYGEYLPSIFWVHRYWLLDWWLFYLPIPPYGYVWVRYGDDVILVNIYTGEILEVEYDVFY